MSARKNRLSNMPDCEGLIGSAMDPSIEMQFSDLESDDPPLKKEKLHPSDLLFDPSPGASAENYLKTLLFQVRDTLNLRLCSVENNVAALTNRTEEIEMRIGEIQGSLGEIKNLLEEQNKMLQDQAARQEASLSFACGSVSDGERINLLTGGRNFVGNLGHNVTLITLNSEEDYPDGSWLGDENNPEMRVRVPLSSSDLIHIHSSCRTPEKMALTLLDYLFDRETQAESNLSGTGKHNKKQLDPLLIYGIRCHLIHNYNIGEADWHRIRQNLDSKCRTAFRRKMRGQPLTVKSFRPHRNRDSTADDSLRESRDAFDHNQQMPDFSSHSDDDSMQQSEDSEYTVAKTTKFVTDDFPTTVQTIRAPITGAHTFQIVSADQLGLLNTDKVLQTNQEHIRAAIQNSQAFQIVEDQIFSIHPQVTVSMSGTDDGTLLVNGDADESFIATETETVPDVVIDTTGHLKFQTTS